MRSRARTLTQSWLLALFFGAALLAESVLAQGAGDLVTWRTRLEQGDFISVIPKLEAHLRSKPTDAEAHFLLSRAYYLAGGVVNLGRASDHIRESLKSPAPHLEYLWQQGLILAAQGKAQAAMAALKTAASGDPRLTVSKDAYRFAMDWGAVCWRFGDLRQALEGYRRATREDASQPFPWLNQGVIYLSLNEPERAEPALTKAVAAFQQSFPKHPAFAEAQYWRGRALELLGRYEPARSAYRAAVTLNPKLQVARDALESLGSR